MRAALIAVVHTGNAEAHVEGEVAAVLALRRGPVIYIFQFITTYGNEGTIDYITGSGFISTILTINIIHIHVAEYVQFFDRGEEPAGTLRGGRTGIAVHKLIEGGNGLHNGFLLTNSLKTIRIVGTENDSVLITVNPVDIVSSIGIGGNGNIAVGRWLI